MNESSIQVAPPATAIIDDCTSILNILPGRLSRVQVGEDALLIDGRKRFLFAGDCGYGRLARFAWRDRLLAMKAAGLNAVSFYCVWRFHQPEEERWDWSGNHDLAAFIDLIGELGLYAIFRMGPFVHGEFRNGGYPDWLADKLGRRLRSNDPAYLRHAGEWYRRLIEIAKPRLIDAGGPIIMLQLENELGSAGCKGDDIPRGSGDAEANRRHLEFYCKLIREAGIELPLVDINKIPNRESLLGNCVTTGGHYPASCFATDGELAPFTPHERDGRPYITIETGSGMFLRFFDYPAYRNTNTYQGPIIPAASVEALTHQTAAEGANGVGLFIFCDGQTDGDDNESMIPVRDMNFQAPVSAAGTLRASYRALKRFGWFARAFEAELLGARPDAKWATATACGLAHPGEKPQSADLFAGYGREETQQAHVGEAVPALARVTCGLNLSDSNFLFLRNVSNIHSQWRRDIRIAVTPNQLGCEVYHEYPKLTQLEMPPQSTKILPFFVRLAPHCFLDHSTATLLDRRAFGMGTQVIAHASLEEFTETEVVLPRDSVCRATPGLLVKRKSPNQTVLLGSPSRGIEVAEFSGPEPLRWVLVDSERAGRVWEIGPWVAFSDLNWLESRTAAPNRVEAVALTDRENFTLDLLVPGDCSLAGAEAEFTPVGTPAFGVHRFAGRWKKAVRPALEFVRRDEEDGVILSAAVTPELLETLEDLVIHARYDGAGAQAWLNGKLIGDHYYGRFLEWEIGLARWLTEAGELELHFRDARDLFWELRAVRRLHVTVEMKG